MPINPNEFREQPQHPDADIKPESNPDIEHLEAELTRGAKVPATVETEKEAISMEQYLQKINAKAAETQALSELTIKLPKQGASEEEKRNALTMLIKQSLESNKKKKVTPYEISEHLANLMDQDKAA